MRNNQKNFGFFIKTTAVVLSMFVLLAVSPEMSAEATNVMSWSDNFDQYTSNVDLGKYSYPGTETNTESDVFSVSGASSAGTLVDVTGGKDGKGALVLTADETSGNTLVWNTAKFGEMSVGQTAVLSYDVKFSGLTALSDWLRLSGGTWYSRGFIFVNQSNFIFYDTNSGNTLGSAAITEDVWYTIIVSVTKQNTAVDGWNFAEVRDVSVYDNTGVKIIGHTAESHWEDGSQLAYSLAIPTTSSGEATLTVDNAKMMVYTQGLAPTISVTNIEDNDVDVVRNPNFTFVFDRPVTGIPILKKNGTEAVTAEVAVDMNTITMTVPTNALLEKGTSYTVDFSTVTSTEATPIACVEEITFTTEYANLLNDVSVEAVVGDGTVTATFTLDDPNEYPSFSGYVAAALYDSEDLLKSIDVLSISENTGESINKTFALSAVAGDKIQLMLFDLTKGVAPVASGECSIAVAP